MLRTSPNNHRMRIISALLNLRREWQKAAEGESLLDVEANVGLIFVDLVSSFGLSTHEQSLVLGAELFAQLQELISTSSQN
jgi:hypothetical protein